MSRTQFVMPIKNNRTQRIQILQTEKKRNEQIRQTGINPSKNNYTQCPHCKQQILTCMFKHHIRNCNNAFVEKAKSKCKGCEWFRKK